MKLGTALILLLACKYWQVIEATTTTNSTRNDTSLNGPDLERRRRASDWYVPLHPEPPSKRGKGGSGGGSAENHKQFREGSAGSIKKEWDDESYGNLDGSRAHRAYAAAMRSDPKCARFTRRYPFHIAIGDGVGDGVGDDLHRQEGNSSNTSHHQRRRRGQPSASASQRYAERLFKEASPVVWIVQGGSGLGNGLWGFVLAFAQSLLTGRPLVVASGGEKGQPLPSDFLCDAMECQYPRVDVSFAESFPGTMISHGFQASNVNNIDPCLLRAVGCDKQGSTRKPYMCFAAAALHTLLSGRMNSGYVAKLGPLLDRFVGDRKRFLALLKSDPSSSAASKIGKGAVLTGQQQLHHRPQHQDQWQAMHQGVVLHARTINPASESADTAAGRDAALDAAIKHHQANLRFGLSRAGLCVFEKPTAEALARVQEQDNHRGHQHRHRHRRGLLQEDEDEEKSSQRYLQHQQQQQQHQQLNGAKLVFVASDSLELKQRLHELHDHRGAGTGGRYELEWFNVSNAHIAAISRTSSGDTAHRDGEAAAGYPSSRAATFQLSKLMTFVEFFRLGRASSVIAARLQLDTKTSPLSPKKKGGGVGKFSLGNGLSTFVETAAITGGAALSVCKSQSFGTRGLTERDHGEDNAINPSRVSSSLSPPASAAAAAPLPSLVDFPSRLRTLASTVVVHTVPLTLLSPLPLPSMQTHSSLVTGGGGGGRRGRRRRRKLLGMARPTPRQRRRRLISGGGTTDNEPTAEAVDNHHNHHNHSHNHQNHHREQHRDKPTKDDADDGLKGQRVGNRATDDKKRGSGGGRGGAVAIVVKGVSHAVTWIGGDARHIVFVPCFPAQQACGHGTTFSSTSSLSPPLTPSSSPLWSELSKEMSLLADSTGATIELRPLPLPWSSSSCLAPNSSPLFPPSASTPSLASAPSTPVSSSSSPAHVPQHYHPCCALSEASLGPLALALAVTSGSGGGGGDGEGEDQEEDLRPLDDGTLVILVNEDGIDRDGDNHKNGDGDGSSGSDGVGGKKKHDREIGHSASSSGSSGNANSGGDKSEAPSNSFGMSAASVAVLTAERGGFAASSASSSLGPASSLPISATSSSSGHRHALLHYFVEHLGLASKSSANWNQTTIQHHAAFIGDDTTAPSFAPIDVLNVSTGVFSDSRRQNRSPMLMPGYSTESVREKSIENMLHMKRPGPSKLSLPPKLPPIRSTALPHTAAAATGGDTSIAASSTSSQRHHSYHLAQLETFLDEHFVPCGVGSSIGRGGHGHTPLMSSPFSSKLSLSPTISTVGWSAHLVGSPKFDQITLPWIALWESWVWSQSASSPSTSTLPILIVASDTKNEYAIGECPFAFAGSKDSAAATLTLFASRAGHSCADDLDPH